MSELLILLPFIAIPLLILAIIAYFLIKKTKSEKKSKSKANVSSSNNNKNKKVKK